MRTLLSLLFGSLIASTSVGETKSFAELVQEDEPVAYWNFNDGETPWKGHVQGKVRFGVEGPRPEVYPGFSKDNQAATFGGRDYLRVSGADEASLSFRNGDAITMEAWVKPERVPNGGHVYVIGKGRTHRKGYHPDNQNYALRLTGQGGTGLVSFLFHSDGKSGDWHRWTSKAGLPLDGRWHHIVTSYRFGDPKSIKGYIDGKPTEGTWDMGGASTAEPITDDDELWIGSSNGGSAGNSFVGAIDEVAIYRKALSPERIKQRYRAVPPKPYVRQAELPKDEVLVEIFEGVPGLVPPTKPPAVEYTQPAFGFVTLPRKYSDTALRVEWGSPLLLRAMAKMTLPAGDYEILGRARGDASVRVDGTEILNIPKAKINGGGHGNVKDFSQLKEDGLHDLWPGDNERLGSYTSDGKEHIFEFTMILGEKNYRPEPGESCFALRQSGKPMQLLGFGEPVILDDAGWHSFMQAQLDQMEKLDHRKRQQADQDKAFWKQRHQLARKTWESKATEHNSVDAFLNAALVEATEKPQPKTDDWEFLRRVTVDVIGTVPTLEQIETYFAFPESDRRARYVDYLMDQPGWAHNWVGYWQDVLAENPNILKPTLNNTGPFRWWIYESFRDNKPFDRFVTELIGMDGSLYYGGPGGFAMAAENDVPMAAKAHVVGQAFLGLQMKCARCHDAPFHSFKQEDLFNLAAMLNRGPQTVPKTSSVPLAEGSRESLVINVTLRPGTKVQPNWPFENLTSVEIPEGLLRDPKDSRERLAALITSPTNERFSQVIVNRLWHRYMGRGLVEPVDDWEYADPSNPGLLHFLAREFVVSGYDIKHVAGLILKSEAYQRRSIDPASVPEGENYLFAGPVRRRMTAEQIVDSMFVASGKHFNASELTFDSDGANPVKTFLNLGRPERAWQFASLSNERDRPSLALPFAQDFVSTLEVFGWRSSRQDPITERDAEPRVLQPATLANGVLTGRVTRLSDDGELADLAVEDQPLDRFLDDLSKRFLTRPTTSRERELFSEVLRDGYDDRVTDFDPAEVVRFRSRPGGVNWSNHLSAEANAIKLTLEKLVRAGDPPTVRLQSDWRERAEDVVWALLNSPEFVWLP